MIAKYLFPASAWVLTTLIAILCVSVRAQTPPPQAGSGDSIACTDGTTVNTKDGPVCGVAKDGVTSYFGIPYAAPPLGDGRFAPPQPTQPWTTTLQATKAPSVCPGPGGNDRIGLTPTGSEDCLHLRVQLPSGTAHDARLPVLVQIHGGGWLLPLPPENGAQLAKSGNVVYVAMHYRLGILGFLAHASLGADSGDWGVLDQQAALRWVRDNVASFGGDPNNVTVLGDSAGGASTCIQIVSPTAKGLFHKAIPESGFYNAAIGPQQVWAQSDCKSQYITQKEAEAAGARFATKIGCDGAQDVSACLRQKDWKVLVMAAGKVNNPTADGTSGTIGPTINAKVLPMSPGLALATGKINDVRIINGAARDEFNGFGTVRSPAAHSPQEYEDQVRKQYGDLARSITTEVYPLERFSSPFIALRTVIADSDTVCPMLALDRKLAKHATLYAYIEDNSDMPNIWPPDTLDPREPNGSYHIVVDTTLYNPEKIAAASPNQAAFVKELMAQVSGFARTGSPMVPGTPKWERFEGDDPQVMMLRPAGDSHLLPASVLEKIHHCGFWNEHRATPKW